MQLTVNGDAAELADDATVADLVAQRAPGHDRVAVARNGDVVPRSSWAQTPLAPGDAVEVLPGITELELTETLARWRPGTPDNAPVLGPSGVPGLVLATGPHRNGVLLTPVTGDSVGEFLATGVLPEVAAPFPRDRFEQQEVLCR